mmetsp:Transcript_13150/g.29950  ORF Transcript_13150/g.29950 Transcript_13150/m.29950 type:complete len:552 (-) Transcript_13150:126-1781(-)
MPFRLLQPLLCASLAAVVHGDKTAFVLLGSTGDNAYRPAGVWTGLFEAWCNGILHAEGVDLHVQVNQGHTVEEIHEKVSATLEPFFETLQQDAAFKCRLSSGDCHPETFFKEANLNLWAGQGRYNASGQAANMSYLAKYDVVVAYMSLPPSAYADWVEAMVLRWGGADKLHLAFEKPFGGGRDSLKAAQDLYADIIKAGLKKENFHLTDHWLSFFMNENLPTFRGILEPLLGINFSTDISKIVVTEYEQRGFGGRGAFIDGLGQVRDMVQSHLLQVLALSMLPPGKVTSAAKLDIFQSLSLFGCELKQFDGMLLSKKLSYHPEFADATFSRVYLNSSKSQWKAVELVIQTGKAMDVDLYTVELFQRNGPGVLTIDIGKEEIGVGDIKVYKWPLKAVVPFDAPLPGFISNSTMKVTPQVSQDGSGSILRYVGNDLYFPKPYSRIIRALLVGDYSAAFVTWQECERCWQIVTSSGPSVCLDPPPQQVSVYIPSFLCDKQAPEFCEQHISVEDQYNTKLKCSPEHDGWYKDVDLYQAKCHPSSTHSIARKLLLV